MLTDTDRFAFTTRRIHSFSSTGNAYDATQCDESIRSGDTLLILDERVVAIAYTWPFAVTRQSGNLHSVQPRPDDTLAQMADGFSIAVDDILDACQLATALGFDIDPAIAAHLPTTPRAKAIP